MENNKNTDTYWSSHIQEYEVDPSWKDDPIYENKSYKKYRVNWEKAAKGEYLNNFPLSLETEQSYYCNLKCPYCPREAGKGERKNSHMPNEIWKKIVDECKENNLNAMQMAHEGESLMNPKLVDNMFDTKKAGIFDTWIHTNGLMLTEEKGRKFIESGLKRLNFSIDAFKEETFAKLRVGGKLSKLKKNILNFLKLKEELKANYLRVRVSFVEQEDNFSEKKDFYNFWSKQKGINVITYQRAVDFTPFEKEDENTKLSEKELEEKYKNEKPFFCGAPWETPIIQEDGKISPCGAPVREHNRDFFIGDISKGDTIKKSWNSKKMQNLRKAHKNNEWYKQNMCRVCVKVARSSQHKEIELNSK